MTSSTATSGWTCRSASAQTLTDTGAEIEPHNSMKTLVNRCFPGEINPSQLDIVREILQANGTGDIDGPYCR